MAFLPPAGQLVFIHSLQSSHSWNGKGCLNFHLVFLIKFSALLNWMSPPWCNWHCINVWHKCGTLCWWHKCGTLHWWLRPMQCPLYYCQEFFWIPNNARFVVLIWFLSGPRGRPPTVVHERGVDHESRASWYWSAPQNTRELAEGISL